MELIRLEEVTKVYDDKAVLNHITKTFAKGASTAFVGCNGCGKSTLLKAIARLVEPTSGKVIHPAPLLFHYIPEKFPPVALTARKYLVRMGAISGMKETAAHIAVLSLADDFFMEEFLDIPMRSLSKGTLQKVGVLQALMIKPDVLLLDEPLSGQDAASQKVFIEKINQLRSEDVTVFMSCHERRLVDAISEEVYTIRDGNLEEYKPEERKIFSLLLEGGGSLPLQDGMTRFGRYYRLKVEESMCDEVLPKLLAQGWRFRGMANEENN